MLRKEGIEERELTSLRALLSVTTLGSGAFFFFSAGGGSVAIGGSPVSDVLFAGEAAETVLVAAGCVD
jgi:hypothetical protein